MIVMRLTSCKEVCITCFLWGGVLNAKVLSEVAQDNRLAHKENNLGQETAG